MTKLQKRVFWIMADSLGVGALPDANQFVPGEENTHTLRSIINATGGIDAPILSRLGLSHLADTDKWPRSPEPIASYGKMAELSPGKDTTTGHWEMAGVPLDHAFPLFPDGFSEKLIADFCQQANVPGVLGNKPASGTDILKELGEEHIKTGKPIVYTSGDSVFQIAAHEKHFGLERLYELCKIARKLCDEYHVGRIIARPFVGDSAATFKRTPNRHDYSVLPPKPTVLDALKESGFTVAGIGKIPDIFAHKGITAEIPSPSNATGMEHMTALAAKPNWTGVAFVNLVDFDSMYGHRRDPAGYRQALEEFDSQLPNLLEKLTPNDLLFITADHGCDPTFKGSDHTREYVPIICYQASRTPRDLGTRKTFSDVAATIAEFLDIRFGCPGTSLLS